jgi:hypothetical protein
LCADFTMRLFTPLYRLFVWAAIILLTASFFTSRQTLDVHLHDTFYILDLSDLFRATAFSLFLLWLLYEVNRRLLYSRKFIGFHVVTTLLGLAFFFGTAWWNHKLLRDRTTMSLDDMPSTILWERLVSFSILLLLAAQVVFILNIVIGLIKGWKRS